MYRGIPLLEIDAIVALGPVLGPVIPEDVTQARKNGITCSSHCHKGMHTLQKQAI